MRNKNKCNINNHNNNKNDNNRLKIIKFLNKIKIIINNNNM